MKHDPPWRGLHCLAIGFALACSVSLAAQAGRGRLAVVDEHGTPVAGAVISRVQRDGELVPMGTTDAEGQFTPSADAIGPERSHIHVAAAGLASITSRYYRIDVSDLMGPAIVLGPGHTLHGRVRDETGRPVVGARVCATDIRWLPRFDVWSSMALAFADEQGIFSLKGVPAENVRLTVDADGYRSVSLAPVALGTPLEVTLEPAGRLAGTVLDAQGQPVAADLEIHYENHDEPQLAHSGADGRFDVTWRHPVFCRLVARHGDPVMSFAHSDVLRAPVADLELRLRPIAELPLLRVRATGDDGKAISDFRAVVIWSSDDPIPEQYLRQQLALVGRLARDGVAYLPAAPLDRDSKGVLFGAASGRAAAMQVVQWAPGADGATEVVLATEPARQVIGVVKDAAGEPVAGVRVWAQRVQKTDWDMSAAASVDAVKTRADGSFVLDGLLADAYDVYSARAFLPERGPKRVVVPATGNAPAIELDVPLHVQVEGRVEGIEAGWQLAFVLPWTRADQQLGGMDLPIQAWAALGADGTFALAGVQTGLQTPTLLVPRPVSRGDWLRVPLPVRRIGADGDEDLQLDASFIGPARLRGRIRRGGAEPPFERLKVLERLEKVPNPLGRGFDVDFRAWRTTALVQGDGSFELSVVAGKHWLRVVDTMTGIVLMETLKEIVAEAGETVEVPDLVLDIAELRLELVSIAAGERGPGLHLLHRKVQADANRLGFSMDDYLRPGIDLRDRLTTDVLYVPAGEGKFVLERRTLLDHVTSVADNPDVVMFHQGDEGDVIEFEAVSGRPTRLRIEVPRRDL